MVKIINETENQLNYKINITQYVNEMQKEMNDFRAFTIVFVTNKYIKKLNKEFRDKDYSTDVLTFVENTNMYLGDIIISLEKAEQQAKEYNHSKEREVLFLITHGFLHLLGYDHQNAEQEEKMNSLQEKILNKYGTGRY